MKDKKTEDVKEAKIEVIKTKKNIITKDRVISFAIGIFIGALITCGVTCLCARTHHPREFDEGKIQIQDMNRPNMQRKHNIPYKRYKKSNATSTEENSTTENVTQ